MNTKYENEIHVKNNTLLSFLNIEIITKIFMIHVDINQSSNSRMCPVFTVSGLSYH